MNSVAQLLSPGRSLCRVHGGSKKRVFELIADTLAREQEEFHPAELVAGLLAREKLGSTALGDGIAIPHCRLRDCEHPFGVLITLVPDALRRPGRTRCRSPVRAGGAAGSHAGAPQPAGSDWRACSARRVLHCPARLPHLRGALQHGHQLG
jgi:hypothetical protein